MRIPPKFEPHWGECLECAGPMWMTSPAKKYCDKCRERHKRQTERQYRLGPYFQKRVETKEERMARFLRQMAVEAKLEEDRTRHVCTHTASCIYGSGSGGNRWCNYLYVTGKMRTAGGKHQIVDGKCDLYKRGKQHNEVGLKL